MNRAETEDQPSEEFMVFKKKINSELKEMFKRYLEWHRHSSNFSHKYAYFIKNLTDETERAQAWDILNNCKIQETYISYSKLELIEDELVKLEQQKI